MRRPGEPLPTSVPIERLPPDLAVIPWGGSGPDDPEFEEHIRTALYESFGNTGRAAELLEVSPGTLARQIELSPTLKADRDVARRMIVDLAEQNVINALLDEVSQERRDEMAKYVLSSLGKSLGWGTSAASQSAGFSLTDQGGRTLSVKWQTDTE